MGPPKKRPNKKKAGQPATDPSSSARSVPGSELETSTPSNSNTPQAHATPSPPPTNVGRQAPGNSSLLAVPALPLRPVPSSTVPHIPTATTSTTAASSSSLSPVPSASVGSQQRPNKNAPQAFVQKTTEQAIDFGETAATPSSQDVKSVDGYQKGKEQSSTVSGTGQKAIEIPDKGTPVDRIEYTDNFAGKALLANHFSITTGSYKVLYRYDLAFLRRETQEDRGIRTRLMDPPTQVDVNGVTYLEIDPARQKRRRLIWLVMERLMRDNPDIPFATDYFEQIISGAQVPADADAWPVDFVYRDEYEIQPAQGADEFRVLISGPVQLSLPQLFEYLSTQNPNVNDTNYDKQPIIRALNTIFSYRPYQSCFRQPNQPPTAAGTSRHPKLTTKNGTQFHGVATQPPTSNTETGEALSINAGNNTIPGFARSVRTSVSEHGSLTLNVNTGTSIFYQHSNTLQGLIDIWWKRTGANAPPLSQTEIRGLNKFLKNINVRTNYHQGTPLGAQGQGDFIGRVTGLALANNNRFDPTPSNCAMRGPGVNGTPTVEQHFQLPNNTNTLVVYLGEGRHRKTAPAHLLNVIPGQMNRNTDEKPRAGIRSPIENRNLLLQRGRQLFLGTSATEGGAQQFQLGLGQNLIRVPIRTLKIPAICYYKSQYRSHLHKWKKGDKQGLDQPVPQQPDASLPAPSLVKAEADLEFQRTLKYGSWNLAGKQFLRPAKDVRWTYVELRLGKGSGCERSTIDEFRRWFPEVMKEVGMNHFQFVPLPDHHVKVLPYPELPSYEAPDMLDLQDRTIEAILTELKQKHKVQAVVVFLPYYDIDLYGAVKRAGDQKVGITTICHKTKAKRHSPGGSYVKFDPGFLANLTLKMNLKADQNAVNHALQSSALGSILNQDTLVLGIDVTHPGGSAMKDSPSIAAVVGSVDGAFAQWPASLSSQMPEPKDDRKSSGRKQAVEKILELEQMVKERVDAYCTRRRRVPRQIVVYRDGLSEEQFQMCQTFEYPKIQEGVRFAKHHLDTIMRRGISDPKGLERLDADLKIEPKILLICAVKRHHTRMYPEKNNEQDRTIFIGGGKEKFNTNPLPGTLVTHRITYGTGRDFFLYSQNALQGTARPTHYTILVDEIGCSTLDVAQMTHNLSYLFGRATRSTGLCAPVYYADLAADRARHYVRKVYHNYVAPNREQQEYQDGITPFDLRLHDGIAEQMFYL